MPDRKTVLFVFPTDWDVRQLETCREAWAPRFHVEFTEPSDWDCPWDLDILGWIDAAAERWQGKIQGVASSSDYPGATVAGALATRLGLPGPAPRSVIACSHKHVSRLEQRAAVPEATCGFDLVDPDALGTGPSFGFPCFVKPVKGAFSIMAGKIENLEQLRGFFSRPAAEGFRREYMHIFNQLAARFIPQAADGRYFLAEQLLSGDMVTVEGFSVGDRVEILGVTDSVVHPRTKSFEQFVFPSALPAAVQERMADLARRAIRGLDLRDAFFNIEMIRDATTGSIHIIEVNPRICGQFADLYGKVLGRNSFELLLELATGGNPRVPEPQGGLGVAASVPLRVYEPVAVTHAPTPDEIRAVETANPGTLVWNECKTGQILSDFESLEDGKSFRYGVVNLGARDRSVLPEIVEKVTRDLGYRFRPLGPGRQA